MGLPVPKSLSPRASMCCIHPPNSTQSPAITVGWLCQWKTPTRRLAGAGPCSPASVHVALFRGGKGSPHPDLEQDGEVGCCSGLHGLSQSLPSSQGGVGTTGVPEGTLPGNQPVANLAHHLQGFLLGRPVQASGNEFRGNEFTGGPGPSCKGLQIHVHSTALLASASGTLQTPPGLRDAVSFG